VPFYEIDANKIDISRNAILIDTNVLIAAFLPDEPRHAEARYFLDEFQHQWLIPTAVVVETWGWIVGKRGNWQAGYRFLAWLTTPGKEVVVLPQHSELAQERAIVEGLQLDCVDAMIVNLATKISIQCALEHPLPVATFDTRDFFRLGGRRDIRLRVYDLKELIIQDLG
jgi:predicted nucleic acid-binding protein